MSGGDEQVGGGILECGRVDGVHEVGTMRDGRLRRAREAAFLPVQSPTEGHLRWVLQNLA